MKRVLLIMLLALTVSSAGWSAEAGRAQGKPIPYKVIPMEDFAAFVKNWSDESAPHYAIVGNIEEWKSVFSPAATMGNKKPFQPDPAIFQENVLVAISRVSDMPGPGEKVLAINSFIMTDGEAVLTYTFTQPAKKASYKVKNTLLIMMPAQYQDVIRFVEDEQTPDSLAAQAELEAAKAAGRYKQPTQPMAPGQMPPPPVQQQAPRQQPPPARR